MPLALLVFLLSGVAPDARQSHDPAQISPDMLAQSVQFSPQCVTNTMICFVEPPLPVGTQCQCPDQSWGTIQR